MNYSAEHARQSTLASFPFRVIYVDYRLIGTHEDQEPKAEQEVYTSMLENGYDGPPIAVFQLAEDSLFNSNAHDLKVNEEYGIIGVADGHHRFKAIRMLGEKGLLKEVYIPVQLIPAHNSEVIRIGTLHEDEAPLSIEEIESCFTDPAKVIPICTSHFQTKLKTSEWARLQVSQPDIKIPRSEFIV